MLPTTILHIQSNVFRYSLSSFYERKYLNTYHILLLNNKNKIAFLQLYLQGFSLQHKEKIIFLNNTKLTASTNPLNNSFLDNQLRLHK